MSNYIAVAKLDCVNLVNDDEEVIPGNLGALKKGLEALLSEDSRDNARANALWAEAGQLLTNESQDDEGAGAQGAVSRADDFDMASMGDYPFSLTSWFDWTP